MQTLQGIRGNSLPLENFTPVVPAKGKHLPNLKSSVTC